MAVVDASVIVRLLQNRASDEALRERIGQERRIHAPSLIDAQVASAIRGLLRTSKVSRISEERAEQMLADFSALPLSRYPMLPYVRDVLTLRENYTVYDAFYLVLAKSLAMPLLTCDQKFARAPLSDVTVETWKK